MVIRAFVHPVKVGRQPFAAARGRFFLAPKKINRIKTLLLFKEESPPQAGEVVWLMSAWECRPT